MADHCKISTAFVAESEEKSYVLKVEGYSRSTALLKNSQCLTSAPFSVGGHSWAVRYYPNVSVMNTEYVYLFLVLDSTTSTEYVKARFTVSVLDKNGEPVPSFSRTVPIQTFTSKGSYSYTIIEKADLDSSTHLRDDCLSIRCDVTVMTKTQSDEIDQFVVVPPSDLDRHLGDLLNRKDAADLTIQVDGENFSAHRCVLAARSSVFKAELLGGMKESSPSPIEICDMEADVFRSLLHFIYTDIVPPPPESARNNGESRGDVAMAGHLLVAADRYNIGRLKLICEQKLRDHIDSDMVATSLALAEQHGCHGLKEACLKFLDSPSNLEAMMASDGYEHLKSSCPSVLKELIARILPAELKAAKDLIMSII